MSVPKMLDADYVVYGAGAMGMAFVDVLVTETKSTIVLVDDHSQPGGHWNDVYPFVRLHQPSAYYGVNSRILERSRDLTELASSNEVLGYFEAVLESFTKSGRVQYFPMCRSDDYSSRSFRSLVNPNMTYMVSGRAKIIDATYMGVVVPSRSHPAEAGRYEVAEDVELIPINLLVKVGLARDRYVVVGAGKTGMDAVLWLMEQGVDPDRITWVMPRDAWVISREIFTFTQNPSEIGRRLLDFWKGMGTVTSVEELYLIGEEAGVFQRLDPSVQPTRNKCATVNSKEMERLRGVKNVVRAGRLRRIEKDQLLFASGAVVQTGSSTLYVDCTADALSARPSVPVFRGEVITLQSVALCQQVFSASAIGHLEARGGSDDEKNALSSPVPHPDQIEDFFAMRAIELRNHFAWNADPDMARWLKNARLFDETSMAKYAHFSKMVLWFLGNFRELMSMRGFKQRLLANIENITSKL